MVRDEPIRVKINCRDPATIRCVIEVFFNKEGCDIKFVAEGFEDRQILYRGSTSGSGKYDDKKHKRGPGDKDDPRNKRKGDKFERVMREDQDPELSHGDSLEAIDGETHTPI